MWVFFVCFFLFKISHIFKITFLEQYHKVDLDGQEGGAFVLNCLAVSQKIKSGTVGHVFRWNTDALVLKHLKGRSKSPRLPWKITAYLPE